MVWWCTSEARLENAPDLIVKKEEGTLEPILCQAWHFSDFSTIQVSNNNGPTAAWSAINHNGVGPILFNTCNYVLKFGTFKSLYDERYKIQTNPELRLNLSAIHCESVIIISDLCVVIN